MAAKLVEGWVSAGQVRTSDDGIEQDHLHRAALAIVRQGHAVIARNAGRVVSCIGLCIDHVEGQHARLGQQFHEAGDALGVQTRNLDQNTCIALF